MCHGQLAKVFLDRVVAGLCHTPVHTVGIAALADLGLCTGRGDSNGLTVYKACCRRVSLCQGHAIICLLSGSGGHCYFLWKDAKRTIDLCNVRIVCGLIFSGCIADDISIIYNICTLAGIGL